jgi:hypothetical protein
MKIAWGWAPSPVQPERSLGVGRGIVRRIERTHSANTGLEWAQVSVQKADANLGHPGFS